MTKIENYGELISAATGYKLLAYEEYGSYQGDYIAILTNGTEIFLYKGYYGSCSGCDWIEGEADYTEINGEWGKYLTDEQIKSYLPEINPYLIAKDNQIETLLNSDNIEQYFPANTRNDYDDWDWDDIKKMIKEAMNNK